MGPLRPRAELHSGAHHHLAPRLATSRDSGGEKAQRQLPLLGTQLSDCPGHREGEAERDGGVQRPNIHRPDEWSALGKGNRQTSAPLASRCQIKHITRTAAAVATDDGVCLRSAGPYQRGAANWS
ncbi:unnamed protein product [Gadus morhua 'NCC']